MPSASSTHSCASVRRTPSTNSTADGATTPGVGSTGAHRSTGISTPSTGSTRDGSRSDPRLVP